MNYIPKFREIFPELNKVSSEEMSDRWAKLGIDFYTEEKSTVKTWVRFTLPFALLLMILMFVLLPIVFIIRGEWNYPLSEKSRVYNWFRSLKLTS
jgi:hypothetical protein